MPDLTPEQEAAVQAEVQRVAAGIREEARTQGATARQAEIDAFLAEQAEAQRLAALEGEELLRAEAATANTNAQAAQAERDRLAAELANTTALVTAGVNPAHLGDALRLLDAPADADEAARTAAAEALKGRMAALFSTAAAPPPPAGSNPPPAVPAPGTSGGGTTAKDRAAARFAALNPQRTAA